MIDATLFRCAHDQSPLVLAGTSLRCDACGAHYPIRDGAARFLADSDAAIDGGFDRRWREHPRFQASRGDFWRKTGWTPADIAGRTVLDGGCGAGRYLAVAAGAGARVVGIDATPHALAASRANVPGATLAQADLLALPIRDGAVDAAYSLGVLHHTADPARAFAELARTVRPGGRVSVWVYAQHVSDPRAWPAFDWLHDVTRACPPAALYAACAKHAVAMRGAYAGTFGPLAQVARASNGADDEECVSDTFDWHAPRYRSWHTADEVRGWFERAGCDVTYVGDFPVSVGGIKRGG